jgi:hypothetical protein
MDTNARKSVCFGLVCLQQGSHFHRELCPQQFEPVCLNTTSANSAVNKISQLSCKQNQPTQPNQLTQPKSANSAKISQLSPNQPTQHVVGNDDEKRGFGAHAPPPTFMSRLKQDVY